MRTKPYLRRIDMFSFPNDSTVHFTCFDSTGRELHTRRLRKLTFRSVTRLCNTVNGIMFHSEGHISVSADGWAFTQYQLERQA